MKGKVQEAMARNRVLILLVVVVLFLAVGGFLIARSVGGGGRPVTIDLTVSGSTLTPDTPTAKQGDRVTMTITADKAEEIHLHGYDIPFQVPSAGGKVTHTFTADKSGSFEMELEATSTHLGEFQVSP
jgi:FtsP/CotA-like multicopper oxidase with cupredoxin domain